MVKVSAGDVLVDIKRGTSAKGNWGFASAKAEKGFDKIQVWFSNPDDITDDDCAVEIISIDSAEITAHKFNEKWIKDFEVRATVKGAGSGAAPIEDNFDPLSDADVPF